MRGHIEDFIRTMDERSNEAATYGVKVTYLELRDIGRRHQRTYGEENVEDLIRYLENLAGHPDMHPKAKPIIKLQASALRQRVVMRASRQSQITLEPGVYRTRNGSTVEVWPVGKNALHEDVYMGNVPGLGYMRFTLKGICLSGDKSLDLVERER